MAELKIEKVGLSISKLSIFSQWPNYANPS